ncbi:MAG: DUF424 domain-containing protein, partial [Halobacteriaceae archaeon]
DQGILGQTFEDGNVSITVSEDFYGGDIADPDEVKALLDKATIGNLVGTDCIALAIEEGYVDEENVLDIESTRHAQFLRL